jgi:hypothetical protein
LAWISNLDPQKLFVLPFFSEKKKNLFPAELFWSFSFRKKKKSIKEPRKPRISIFAKVLNFGMSHARPEDLLGEVPMLTQAEVEAFMASIAEVVAPAAECAAVAAPEEQRTAEDLIELIAAGVDIDAPSSALRAKLRRGLDARKKAADPVPIEGPSAPAAPAAAAAAAAPAALAAPVEQEPVERAPENTAPKAPKAKAPKAPKAPKAANAKKTAPTKAPRKKGK